MGQCGSVVCGSPYPGMGKVKAHGQLTHALVVFFPQIGLIVTNRVPGFNFLGGISSLRQVCFFKISIKFSFFIPNMTYFKEKNFHLSEGPFFKIFHTRNKKRWKRHKMKKNSFSKTILYIFC
jgi:hypothetical protein